MSLSQAPFAQWKDLFGKPREGVHRYRMFGLAAVDLILTLLLAWVIARLTQKSVLWVFVALMVLSILFHLLFGVRTAVIEKLGFQN